jgi:hypothetical protein
MDHIKIFQKHFSQTTKCMCLQIHDWKCLVSSCIDLITWRSQLLKLQIDVVTFLTGHLYILPHHHILLVMGSNNGNPKSFQDELTVVETHPLVITWLTDLVSKNSGVKMNNYTIIFIWKKKKIWTQYRIIRSRHCSYHMAHLHYLMGTTLGTLRWQYITNHITVFKSISHTFYLLYAQSRHFVCRNWINIVI